MHELSQGHENDICQQILEIHASFFKFSFVGRKVTTSQIYKISTLFFGFMAVINGSLELGMSNMSWRQIINMHKIAYELLLMECALSNLFQIFLLRNLQSKRIAFLGSKEHALLNKNVFHDDYDKDDIPKKYLPTLLWSIQINIFTFLCFSVAFLMYITLSCTCCSNVAMYLCFLK